MGLKCSLLEWQRLAQAQRREVAASQLQRSAQWLDAGYPEQAEVQAFAASRTCPENPDVWSHLGRIMVRLQRLDEAVRACEEAVRLAPAAAEGWNNLGTVRQALAQWDEASGCYRRALERDPGLAAAHVNLALIQLLRGEYPQGWREYRWRHCLDGGSPDPGNALPPSVDSLVARRVLLQAEQGLGDTIQMVRYARLLRGHAAHVTIRCPPRLVPLLAASGLADRVLGDDEGVPPDADVCVPMMSLPELYGTTVTTIPTPTPYLQADPARSRRWRHALAPLAGLRVGIAWQGNPTLEWDAERSIPLAAFASLAQPGVDLISLQWGAGTDQIAPLREALHIHLPGAHLDRDGAFLDTAAILRHLDLVVTCDTAITHLAGALGVPVWVAIGLSPHWVWLLGRDDSPWYPSVRLFRQVRSGDWSTVFRDMATALARQLGAGCPDLPLPAAAPPLAPPEAASGNALHATVHTWAGWMVCPLNDVYVGQSLIRWGEYSRAEAELLCSYLRPGDTVVECGAHVGAHTLPLARAVGATGIVHAFEPQRFLLHMLCANLALNDVGWVHCQQAAVGARAGSVRCPVPDYSKPGNFGGVSLGGRAGEATPVVTIDALGLGACRLIKADVEGMEVAVLRGARDTIRRHRPILYLEADREERLPTLIRHLRAAAYRLYWHLPPIVQPESGSCSQTGADAALVSVNLLCLPDDSLPVPAGVRAVQSPDESWRPLLEHGAPAPTHLPRPPSPASVQLAAPISPGELLDRLAILGLKAKRLPDPHRRHQAARQSEPLQTLLQQIPQTPALAALAAELDRVNTSIWDVEERVRDHESRQDFGPGFVEAARSVYRLNDRRAHLKTQINRLLGAAFNDDKSHRTG